MEKPMRFIRLTTRIIPGLLATALLFFFSFKTSAYTCHNKQTGKILKGGDSSVTVPISRTVTPGEQVIIDIGKYYECKNDIPRYYNDYMYTQDNASSTTLPPEFETGAYINGGKYSFPLPEVNVLTLPKGGDGNYHIVPIQVFYTMKEDPGKMVKISKGETLAILKLHKYATTTGGPIDPQYFTWNIVADNDAIFTSGSCEINNGRNIDVDFGRVNRWSLISDSSDSQFRRQVDVPYNCTNPVSMSIAITLSADRATFSNDAIKTSNDNLGVQMFENGQLVKPGDSVHTQLVKGIGSSQFEFVLIKNANSTVNTGDFTGRAVLVMSAD
ncbi:fimbrial protein [Serratia symbiotica]|uniref:fimbrial protein n=1 Tax=Serratia symbiotica TaxID=138074 RepID=UPI003463D34B